MKKIAKHLSHYLPLFGIFLFAVIGFKMFSYDESFQVFVVVSASIAYVAWGIVHHLIHKDFYLNVVVEYILFSLLGIIAVLTILLRD